MSTPSTVAPAGAGSSAAPAHGAHGGATTHGRTLGLALGALGIVYGDIGTSPLYALKECFHHLTPTPQDVLGVLSLVVWALVLVIAVKYVAYVMRFDNRGEGGVLALLALAGPRERAAAARAEETQAARAAAAASGSSATPPPKAAVGGVLVALGLFGASLLYGEGMITPAISVLSAVEGLELVIPGASRVVVPITVVILVALFSVQQRGTATIGRFFGPIMLVWFTTLAGLGLISALRHPSVFGAVDPRHAIGFFGRHGLAGYLVLGSVVLVITGVEALYADMGHFGRRPIRIAWFALVLPALLLNYFGQGALLLTDPAARENPFFSLAPEWARLPLVVLATLATVIASQALISGAFSLTRQAIQLGYAPRFRVRHTSHEEIGQIYVPGINWALLVVCVGLVLGFRTSSNLAAAYGIAVTGTMTMTTILFYHVARHRFGWSLLKAGLPTLLFLTVDLAFLGANLPKIAQGGWFPLIVGAAVFTLLTTWKEGEQLTAAQLQRGSAPAGDFLRRLGAEHVARVPGTAVFLTDCPDDVPPRLAQCVRHNKVLHRRVILLQIQPEEVAYVTDDERVRVNEIGDGFTRVTAHYGFTEEPDVPAVLAQACARGLVYDEKDTTYYIGRETVLPSARPGMARWRERLYAYMTRNEGDATTYYRIPPAAVVQLGAQVEI